MKFSDIIESIWDNSVCRIIIIFGIIAFICLGIFSTGFIGAVIIFIAVGLSIYVGFKKEFIYAIIFSLLFHIASSHISSLLAIWFENSKINETCDLFIKLGFIKSVIVVFFFFVTISILCRIVRRAILGFSKKNNCSK